VRSALAQSISKDFKIKVKIRQRKLLESQEPPTRTAMSRKGSSTNKSWLHWFERMRVTNDALVLVVELDSS
jgi:hypothetical protein